MSNDQQETQSCTANCKTHCNRAAVQNVLFPPETSSAFLPSSHSWLQKMVPSFTNLQQQHYRCCERQASPTCFYLSFRFIPDARIWACLGEDPKHIQICRWNELPPQLFCLYCKWLAFSPHLLASMYSANKVFVLLLLVELQLGERVLPCHPHC